MPNIDLSILNQRQTPAFYADTLANRPAAGFVGRIFVSTNTFAFYRDNGTGWDLIGGPGTGTITGSGATGQIALWDGASTITGDSGLTYNGTDNSLTASKFIVTGGTSSQFLKADGSLDSSAYLTTNIYNGNGTLSAERTVSLNNFNLIFDGGATTARVRLDADTNVARIFSFATNNLPRFAIRVDGTESGGNNGSDYAIRRYDDAGTFVDAPLTITRSTGQSTFAKKVVIENNAGDQQLQIVSTTAPSLRFDNLQTGATKRAGLGISTATNNFIQGSADRDFCMFNGSTTASPILFGIYDAGAVNVQEAARISPARNFLVGTTTDGGQKLQISGGARATSYFLDGMTAGSGALYWTSNRVTLANYNVGGTVLIEINGGANGLLIASDASATFYNNVEINNGYYISKRTDNTSVLRSHLVMQRGDGTGTYADIFTSGNTTNGVASLSIGFNSSPNVTITSNGNVGIGITPNTWTGTNTKALQFGNTGALGNSGTFGTILFNNSYYDSGYKYISSNPASAFVQDGNTHIFYQAPSGTAGNAITFTQAMTLNGSTGNLLIGTTTDAGQKLQVNGTAKINSDLVLFNNTVASYSPGNISTTFVATGATSLFCSLVYIVYADSVTGLRDFALVSTNFFPAGVVVISSTNNGGNGVTFQMNVSSLEMKTTVGTVQNVQIFQIK